MTESEQVTNAVSFDLEHWHSATLLSDEVDDPKDRIESSMDSVLDTLRRCDTKATFFVVGEIALEYPEILSRIDDEGHEIASHGYTHTPLFDLTEKEFERELVKSTETIERITGKRPIGFRAPNFSITPETKWAFPILESNGYRYDSSVFPVRTPLYGVSGAPVRPYEVDTLNPFREASNERYRRSLVEYPVSAMDVGFRFPIAGGFYARVTPTWLLKRGIRRLNARSVPANLYFHPWEFNSDVRVDSVPFHKRFISFYGIERLQEKVEELLSTFEFAPIRDVVRERTESKLESDGAGNRATEVNTGGT